MTDPHDKARALAERDEAGAVRELTKRAAEIEAQTAKFGERWWPEGVAHAASLRTLLSALATAQRERDEARKAAEERLAFIQREGPINGPFNEWIRNRRAAALAAAGREGERDGR